MQTLSAEVESLDREDRQALDRCFQDADLHPLSVLLAEETEQWAVPEDSQRDTAPSTQAIKAALALEPGMSAGDVGAGAGYFSFVMAEEVGPTGSVWATDTNTNMVVRIMRTARERHLNHVRAVLVHENQIGLPQELDRVLISNVYLFDECRRDWNDHYLQRLANRITPDGRLVVYEDSGIERSGCRSLDADGLVAAAEPYFSVIERHPAPFAPPPGRAPGFLLVLQPREAVASPAGTTSN